MRKQTNLAEVKLTALALLSTEINETPYSPMIVKHPFTDTGVSAIPDGKGGVEMIDLTEDDAQLRWRQSMARQIDKADNAYAIYMMVTKPYALTFLKFAMPHLSREDMSQILSLLLSFAYFFVTTFHHPPFHAPSLARSGKRMRNRSEPSFKLPNRIFSCEKNADQRHARRRSACRHGRW